jgi:hypothetical protein
MAFAESERNPLASKSANLENRYQQTQSMVVDYAIALALGYAPQLFAFLVALPYFGVPISVLLFPSRCCYRSGRC